MQAELINALQLILMIAVFLCVACHIVTSFRLYGILPYNAISYSEVKLGLAYSRELTVLECETYHKFEIWRYYLFS